MLFAQLLQHAFQNSASQRCCNLTAAALHGNTDKTQLRNGRCEQHVGTGSFDSGNPAGNTLVFCMITPPPGDEDVDIQKIVHGKSDSISPTLCVVRAGAPATGANISAPVN